MIRAAALDQVIALKPRQDSVPNEYGVALELTGVPQLVMRAQLLERKAEEQLHDSGRITKTVLSFRLRYVPGVKPGDQLQYDGVTYDILTVTELGRRKGLEITCAA